MKSSELDAEITKELINRKPWKDCNWIDYKGATEVVKIFMAKAVIDTEYQNALFNHDQQ